MDLFFLLFPPHENGKIAEIRADSISCLAVSRSRPCLSSNGSMFSGYSLPPYASSEYFLGKTYMLAALMVLVRINTLKMITDTYLAQTCRYGNSSLVADLIGGHSFHIHLLITTRRQKITCPYVRPETANISDYCTVSQQ